MPKKKLTLSIDDTLINRAKKIASERGTSVSNLVEQYFGQLSLKEAENTLDYTFSDWARRWYGSGRVSDEAGTEDDSILIDELEKKHL